MGNSRRIGLTARISPYARIARADHWFKSVFVLPGAAVALYAVPGLCRPELGWRIILAVFATSVVSSSNYVLNELLDAPFDALHPTKRQRPVPSGQVRTPLALAEWLGLGLLGLVLSWPLGGVVTALLAVFWLMGCLYNCPPLRTKDRPYLDVLTESLNNPLRLLVGWYATGIGILIPMSLVLAYWMLGAFFMGVKRLAEYRYLGDKQIAAAYRQSFRHYTEERLLVSCTYYAAAFGLCFGVFLIRYHLELLLTVPLWAGLIAWYIHLGFQDNSLVQRPEHLYRNKGFVAYIGLCTLLSIAMLFIDIPFLHSLLEPTLQVVPSMR